MEFYWISEFWGSVLGVLLRKSQIFASKIIDFASKIKDFASKISDFGRFPHILKVSARAGPHIL